MNLSSSNSTPSSAASISVSPNLPSFLTFEPAHIFDGANVMQTIWPKIDHDRFGNLHMVSMESNPTVPTLHRIYYSRGVPSYNQGGHGTNIVSETVASPNLQYRYMDTSRVIGADIACSRYSDRIAIAYPSLRPSEQHGNTYADNDLFLLLSEDGGHNWQTRHNLTNLADRDTLRVLSDCSVIFDANDNIHVAFSTYIAHFIDGYYRGSVCSFIWHWSEQTDSISLVARGDFNVDNSEWGSAGDWQLCVQRPSLAIDEVTGNLYCSYQRYDTLHVSDDDYPQGDAFVSVSQNGGLSWAAGTNVTNMPHANHAPVGACTSVRDITVAREIGYANGSGFLHMEYELDRRRRNSHIDPPPEGDPTLNPIYYQRIPVNSIATTPLMPFLPFHNGEVPPPRYGRCCYGSNLDPYCGWFRQFECDAVGGVWDTTESLDTRCPVCIIALASFYRVRTVFLLRATPFRTVLRAD